MTQDIKPGLYFCTWKLETNGEIHSFYNYHGENGKWYNGTNSIEDIISMCQDHEILFIGDRGIVDPAWTLLEHRALTSVEIKMFLM